MKTVIHHMKSQMKASRDRRLEHAKLRRELASYATQSEIDDLLAAFARHDSVEVEEARMLLMQNRSASIWAA